MASEQEKLDVSGILERVAIFYQLESDVDIARFFGFKGSSAIGNWRREQRINLDVVVQSCRQTNQYGQIPSLHWVIQGVGSREVDNQPSLLNEFVISFRGRGISLYQLCEVLMQQPPANAEHRGAGTVDTLLDVIEQNLGAEDPERRTKKRNGSEEIMKEI